MRRPNTPLRRLSVVSFTLTLTVGVLVSGYAGRQVRQNEQALVNSRAADVALVANQLISRLETTFVSLHAVAAVTNAEPDAFREAARPAMATGVLTSAMVIGPGGERRAVIGDPALPAVPADSTGQRLKAAMERGGLTWVGSFGGRLGRRFGFAYAPAASPGTGLVYAELQLTSIPALLPTQTFSPGSKGVNNLQVALYAGPADNPDALLFSLARHLPLTGIRAAIPVPVGHDTWTVVVAPYRPFTGPVAHAAPSIVLAVSLLLAVLLGTIVEIGGRRRRDALQAREERFRLLVQEASDIVTVVDPGWVVGYHSPSAERVLGYATEKLTGRRLLDLVHPEDTAALDAALHKAVDDKDTTLSATARVVHRDGHWLRLEVTGRNLIEEPSVGGLVLNWRDVTERTEAEAARSLLASVIEATPELVLTANVDDNVAFLNSAWRSLAGIGPDDDVADYSVASFFPGWVVDSLLAEALTTAELHGSWRGEMVVLRSDGDEIPVLAVIVVHRDDAGTPCYVSVIAHDISERKDLERQLAHQAFTDALTDLPNRALFGDRLVQAVRRARRHLDPVAVLLVDLDDFKTVNDSLGHAAGDALLVAAADRLRSCLRPHDTLARLGGDEFAVVIEVAAGDAPASVAERIVQAFAAPFWLGDREVMATASVGVAVLAPVDLGSPEDALRAADVALYAAKRNGKASYAVFDPPMLDASVERLELRVDLGRALERGQLLLHYQPIVELASGRVTAVEALLRWNHPRHGLLAPARFVTLAEETGLIVPIGRWALREACVQMASWQAHRPDLCDLVVSVNVSGRQLIDPEFVHSVASVLDDTGLGPERLLLEITESVLVEYSSAVDVLRALKQLGVRLAIDDFGTGYSSLNSLQHLPVDALKIDKSFVDAVGAGQRDPTLVTAILRIGETMGLQVVAEGVEQEEQAAGLSVLNCPLAQGYYFARPDGPTDVENLLPRLLPLGRTRDPSLPLPPNVPPLVAGSG